MVDIKLISSILDTSQISALTDTLKNFDISLDDIGSIDELGKILDDVELKELVDQGITSTKEITKETVEKTQDKSEELLKDIEDKSKEVVKDVKDTGNIFGDMFEGIKKYIKWIILIIIIAAIVYAAFYFYKVKKTHDVYSNITKRYK